MNNPGAFATKICVALGAAICLVLGSTVMPTAAASNAAANGANQVPQVSHRLVLHGINFDSRTGQLSQGSKAVLDDAAQFLKANPDTVVFVSEPQQNSNHACNLSAAEARTITAYMKKRGAPQRIMLCETRGFRVAER